MYAIIFLAMLFKFKHIPPWLSETMILMLLSIIPLQAAQAFVLFFLSIGQFYLGIGKKIINYQADGFVNEQSDVLGNDGRQSVIRAFSILFILFIWAIVFIFAKKNEPIERVMSLFLVSGYYINLFFSADKNQNNLLQFRGIIYASLISLTLFTISFVSLDFNIWFGSTFEKNLKYLAVIGVIYWALQCLLEMYLKKNESISKS